MKIYRNPCYLYRDEGDRIYIWSFDKGIYSVSGPLAEVIRYGDGEDIETLTYILRTDVKNIEEMINVLKNKGLVLTKQPNIGARYVINKFKYPSAKTAPDGIFYEITYRCNMGCIYCYTKSGSHGCNIQKELTTKEIFNLIDDAADMGVGLLNIGGGEPLLRKDIFDVIRYASEKGLKTSLVTNGTLITSEVANKLKNSGLNYIGISIDGPKDYHDFLRGNYEGVLRGLKILVRRGFWVFVNFVVTKANIDKLEETIKMVKDLGACRFRAIRLAPVGYGKNLRSFMLSPLEYLKFVKLLDELSDKYSDSYFYVYKDYSFLGLMKKIGDNEYGARMDWLHQEYVGCPAFRSFLFINPYGEVYPCGYLEAPEFLVGNIKSQRLRSIWESADNPIIKLFRDMKSLNPICDSCFNRKYCSGGCRALAYSTFKDIYAGDPYCPRYTTLRQK